jgi:hypothetical protein
MAKQTYTDNAFDILLKKNIAMDFIDSISGLNDDLADTDSLCTLLNKNHNEVNFIDSDSIY